MPAAKAKACSAAIRQVINDNIINPADSDRAISNFLMDDPVGFTDETEVQLLG
jgi:uncharacterized protein YaiL (DUF2058 family)